MYEEYDDRPGVEDGEFAEEDGEHEFEEQLPVRVLGWPRAGLWGVDGESRLGFWWG